MSITQRSILLTVAGGLSGLLVWLVLDQSMLPLVLMSRAHALGHDALYARLMGGCCVGLVGIFLGVADAMTLQCPRKRVASILAFVIVGAIAGVLAQGLSPIFPTTPEPQLAGPVVDDGASKYTLAGSAWRGLSPVLAWSLLWCLLGSIPGVIRTSFLLAWQGAFGAVLGGALGGTLVQASGHIVGGRILQAALFLLGIALPVFTMTLLQSYFRRASIEIVEGPDKGAEFLLGRRVTTFGGTNADIAVVAGRPRGILAVIEDRRDGFYLTYTASTPGNPDNLFGPIELGNGDSAQVGECRIRLKFERDDVVSDDVPHAVALKSVPPTMPDLPPEQVSEGEKRGVFAAAALRPAAPAVLVCVAGPYSGMTFNVPPKESVTVGRGDDQDISLPDDANASKAHARIVLAERRHLVVDNESANGTYLNGNAVTDRPRRIFPGDSITIGQTELVYQALLSTGEGHS